MEEIISYCLSCRALRPLKNLIFRKQNSTNKMYCYVGECMVCSGNVMKLSQEPLSLK